MAIRRSALKSGYANILGSLLLIALEHHFNSVMDPLTRDASLTQGFNTLPDYSSFISSIQRVNAGLGSEDPHNIIIVYTALGSYEKEHIFMERQVEKES